MDRRPASRGGRRCLLPTQRVGRRARRARLPRSRSEGRCSALPVYLSWQFMQSCPFGAVKYVSLSRLSSTTSLL